MLIVFLSPLLGTVISAYLLSNHVHRPLHVIHPGSSSLLVLPQWTVVSSRLPIKLRSKQSSSESTNEEYSNGVAKFLGTFIPKKDDSFRVIDEIDWMAEKRRISSIESLVEQITPSLCAREWFVTGNIDPSFFSDDFVFEDPDVKVKGVREYAIGVRKIFDQAVSRAEVMSVDINSREQKDGEEEEKEEHSFTVTWRLSGRVNIGFGLNIKPYIIYTDFTVSSRDNSNNLIIVSQVDRFSIPGYDILLSALFPFLIPFLTPPAPPVGNIQ